MSKRSLKDLFAGIFSFSFSSIFGTQPPAADQIKFEGTVAEAIKFFDDGTNKLADQTAEVLARLREYPEDQRVKVIQPMPGVSGLLFENGCGRPNCTTCGKSSKSSAGRPDDFGDFIGEFEEFFGGRRQRPSWRITLGKFRSGFGNEPDLDQMINKTLGLQAFDIARLRSQLTGIPLTEIIKTQMGGMTRDIAEAAAGEAAVIQDASELYEALGEAESEMGELLERLEALVQSAGSSERAAFTPREIMTAVYRAKRGLEPEEHYFPQTGQSHAEMVAANAEAKLARFMAAETALRELGETGVAGVLAQLLSGKGDPVAIIKEKFAAAETTLHGGPLATSDEVLDLTDQA